MSKDASNARHLKRASRSIAGFVVVTLLTFIGLMAITFFIGRVIPIDPVLSVVGDRATQAQYDAAGLNAPQIVDTVLKALKHNSAGLAAGEEARA